MASMQMSTSLLGLVLAGLIVYLVRRDHLYLMHGLLWSMVAAAAALLGAWPGLIDSLAAWLGFAYVGSVSMWAGFFAWFRGLDWGGALRVSQVQLLQPFLSMLFALPLLGERLDAGSIGFALAVVATVVLGRRISRPAAPASVAQGDPT